MSPLRERAARRAARSAVLRRIGFALGGAAVFMVAMTPVVAAHGELFFQLGTDRIQPGGQVEVRADFGAGDAFEIVLVAKGDGSRRGLGALPAVEEGHLQTWLTIPADIAPGDYLVEAAYDLTVLRAPLTVAGAPIPAGEAGQQPGQDEGFAAPSAAGGSGIPAPASSARTALGSTTSSPRGTRSAVDGLVTVGLAAAAAIGLVVLLRIAGTRRRPARGGERGGKRGSADDRLDVQGSPSSR